MPFGSEDFSFELSGEALLDMEVICTVQIRYYLLRSDFFGFHNSTSSITLQLIHAMHNSHKFNHDDINILHVESHTARRKALQELYIQCNTPHAVNFKTDTKHISCYTKQATYAH